jgi:hypothetical protein
MSNLEDRKMNLIVDADADPVKDRTQRALDSIARETMRRERNGAAVAMLFSNFGEAVSGDRMQKTLKVIPLMYVAAFFILCFYAFARSLG